MKPLPILLGLCLGLASATMAHEGVSDPKVKAWMHAMGQAGQASKTLGTMAKGKTPYDVESATQAKASLIDVSNSISILFETQSTDPVSEALPAIWQDYDDFALKAAEMTKAAKALDVSSPSVIGQGLRDLAGTCRSCHRAYRK